MIKLVCISDTHRRHDALEIPPCDILICAGDYSFQGKDNEIIEFMKWCEIQPAKHIIIGQGNHELGVEADFIRTKELANKECLRAHFVEEQALEIEGIKFYCSPVTPFFNDWAYNRERGKDIKKHWDKIPDDVEVLITHGPPRGILDVVNYADGTPKERVGCYGLLERISELKSLKIHIFGHLHESFGHVNHNNIDYYNVSICNAAYYPENPHTEINYEKKE